MSKLNYIINYAYKNVEFYNKSYKAYENKLDRILSQNELVELPIVERRDLQSNEDAFISQEYKKYPKSHTLRKYRTTGSTGHSIQVYWGKADFVASLSELWLIRHIKYNIDPNSRLLSFHTNLYAENKLLNEQEETYYNNGNALSLLKRTITYENATYIYKKISDFQPEWLFIQPSIALLFINMLCSYNLKLPDSLRYIELSGEYLFPIQKKQLMEKFPNVMFGNLYGASETNGIAYECENNKFHILNSNIIIETDNLGNLLLTSLNNRAMPLIRYRIGDKGKLINEYCACGYNSNILELLSTRNSEYIILKSNRKMNPCVFLESIDKINEYFGNPILQIRIIQDAINKFNVIFVIREKFNGWKNTITKFFIENIPDIELKQGEYRVDFTNEYLTAHESLKLNYFYGLQHKEKVNETTSTSF